MRIVITDDILNECENTITMFSDIEYIKGKIIGNYPNLSITKQNSVPKRIKAFINQGLHFLNETDDNIYTAPLTLFYSINNFSKAIYLVNSPNLSISNSHGIELSKEINIDNNTRLADISIVRNNKGTFSNLISITHDEIELQEKINLKDIISIMPEMIDTYANRYNEEPRVFLLQKEERGVYNVLSRKKELAGDIINGNNLIQDNSCHFSITNETKIMYLDADFNETKKEKCFYYDVYGNEYVTLGLAHKESNIKINKLTCLYICYYVFSMMVRYYPEVWFNICDSADAAIVRKLFIHCRKEMLVEVLQLLTGEKYCYVTKLENLRKEIDIRELYEQIKQEYRSEKHRSGRIDWL